MGFTFLGMKSRIVPYRTVRSRIFLWLPLLVESQSYSITEIQTCPDGNYFNGATLSCAACPNGAVSSDGNCVCPPRFRKVYSVSGETESWECSECQEATTLDKFQCWSSGDCPSGVDTNTGFCQCGDGERLVERNSDGSKLNRPICEPCDPSTTLQSDQSRDQCAVCPRDWPILTSSDESDTCQCATNLENVCFNSAITIESTILKTVQRAGAQRQSYFITENLIESYKRCKEERHAISCNQLANMCILQFAVDTACELLEMSNTGGDISDRLGWPQDLPWVGPLRQTDFEVITTDETVQTDFGFSDSLPIVAAKYDLQGKFHGYIPVTNGLLQLCKYPEPALNAAWYYSAPYSASCDVSASNLNGETIFYELFLKHGTDQLFPILVDASCDETCPFSLVQSSPGAANFQYTRKCLQ